MQNNVCRLRFDAPDRVHTGPPNAVNRHCRPYAYRRALRESSSQEPTAANQPPSTPTFALFRLQSLMQSAKVHTPRVTGSKEKSSPAAVLQSRRQCIRRPTWHVLQLQQPAARAPSHIPAGQVASTSHKDRDSVRRTPVAHWQPPWPDRLWRQNRGYVLHGLCAIQTQTWLHS